MAKDKSTRRLVNADAVVTMVHEMTAIGDKSTALLLRRSVGVQITGSADLATVVVERHPDTGVGSPPSALSAYWAPADSDPITGVPSDGVAAASYDEPGAGWWRVRLTELTGDSVSVAITGYGF